jgi:hypothetical protein
MSELLRGRGDPKVPLDLREAVWQLAELYAGEHEQGPAQQGLLGWTQDIAGGGAATGPSLGVEYLWRVIPVRSGVCAYAWIPVAVEGTSLTAAYVGLRNAAGTLLAKSANQNTSWQTAGNKQVAWATPVTIEAGVPYWVCQVQAGTGSAQILRTGTSDFANVGLGAGKGRFMTLGSGLSDLAASVTMANADATNQHAFIAAISS